jgi:hypothetical protein
LDNASTPSASGGCADASIQACNKGAYIPQHAVATAQRARFIKGFIKGSCLNRIKRLTEAAPKNLFQFSFVCLRRCY